jgi:ABC-type transport system involved in cytochrome c biogenesis ATPase subunit
MFKSVRIQNFRQFKDLKLDGLAQINLITGKNNTGKTSLLEALFLLDGPLDPSRTVVVANFRGISRLGPSTPELWDWLFRNGDKRTPFVLEGEGNDGFLSRVAGRISHSSIIPAFDNGPRPSSTAMGPIVSSATPLPGLIFDSVTPTTKPVESSLRWTSQGLELAPDQRGEHHQGFYLPEGLRAGESEARRLSRLVLNGREHDLVEALRVIEPRLNRLTVLDLDDRPSIYADLGRVPLVPIAMMGQGFGKLLTIIAAILLDEGPIYLIDEVDAGLHYSTLEGVWRTIVRAAIAHSAQVFATTHSLEAINAAVEGSEAHEGSLAFFRLQRRDDDIDVVKGEDFRLRVAARVGTELR